MGVQLYILDQKDGKTSVRSYPRFADAFKDVASMSDRDTLWFRFEKESSMHCPECGSVAVEYNRLIDSMVCRDCQCVIEHEEGHL